MRLAKSVRKTLFPRLAVLAIVLASGRNRPTEVVAGTPLPNDSLQLTSPVLAARMPTITEVAHAFYEEGELSNYGLSRQAFEYAWKGYQYLLRRGKVKKTDVLSICDFSQSSRKKRLYIIDVNDRKVLINTYVAHGRNSGGEYARSFSNSAESHKSSLGFYVTRSSYFGEHGIALKIEGLEKGINDRAYARNIVIHGCNYIGDRFMESNPFIGRSFGCPAVPVEQINDVVSAMKDGSCLFIYYPTKNYLKKSRVLG